MEKSQLSEFVEKAKQGDQAAFEELYSISCKRVYFTCISFLGRAEDAKDAMQEVYITSYEKLASLNDAEKFVPWINRIAVNHCKKILMKKAVVFTGIENVADELTEENENFLPEEYITQKEKRKLVMDIMRNTLSDIQYKTVILYYFNGLPVDEIADIMECPPGTVMYRLSVARAKIRDGVDAYENKSGDKLYSVVGLPLLMRLFYEEADSIDVPDMLHSITEAITLRLTVNTAAAGETAGTAESAAGAGEATGTAESAAGAGEATGTAESAAAGEAARNTAGSIANGIKGGTMKAGMNTLIAKIGIAAAIVAVIAAGAVFLIKNSGDEEASGRGADGSAEEQTAGSEDGNDHMAQTAEEDGAQGQTSGGENDAQGQALEFSGDWDAVEEAGYPPFWLKYANLGALEEKDLSGVMFYDKFAFGASLEEMITSFDQFGYRGYINYDENGGFPEADGFDSLEEFKEWAITHTILAGERVNHMEIMCYPAEEDELSDDMTFEIYNLTDSEITVWECIENNQFYCESEYVRTGYEMFGVPYHTSGGGADDNREGLSELMEILGRPTILADCSNSHLSYADRDENEEFSETVSLGGGGIDYDLVYDKGDYILQIGVSELAIISGSYTCTICTMRYYTKGFYDYTREYKPDSTEIFQEAYDFDFQLK